MNKIDLDLPTELDPRKAQRARLLAAAKRLAVFAAPILVIAGGVLAFAVLMLTGPRPEEKGDAPAAVAVQVATATARPVTVTVNVQGEARPRVEAALAAQVAGRIVWADPAFVEGGAFRAGQTLLRIEDADYRLAVVRARAQVAQAEEGLAREEAEGELARQDWAELGNGGEPSPLAVREPQLAQARATLAAARAQLSSAELDLARTQIKAPFAGRVRERQANIGDYVGPGAAVARVFATDVMDVRVPLTHADLSALGAPVGFAASSAQPGLRAHLSDVQNGRIRAWQGRLVRTEATVDARTRLVYGLIEVRDPFNTRGQAPLAPGMFVSAQIEGPARETMVAAPRSALKRNEFVYVVTPENSIEVRSVRPAQTTADEVMFRAGLNDGERVVVSHLASPRDGMRVTPIARAETEAANPPLELRE